MEVAPRGRGAEQRDGGRHVGCREQQDAGSSLHPGIELGILDEICTPEVAKEWRDGINTGRPFSDHHVEVRQMVADTENVMVVLDTRGLMAGEFHGIPPAGKRFTNRGAVNFHIDDGRIATVDTFFDDLNIVIDQLGATLTPPR